MSSLANKSLPGVGTNGIAVLEFVAIEMLAGILSSGYVSMQETGFDTAVNNAVEFAEKLVAKLESKKVKPVGGAG